MSHGGAKPKKRSRKESKPKEDKGQTGGSGVPQSVPRRRYTKEFKLEAVALSRQPGMTVAQAAWDLGIAENMLHRWRSEYREHTERAFSGHGKRRALEDELQRLRRENERLRKEREILKKATAFFANQPPGDSRS